MPPFPPPVHGGAGWPGRPAATVIMMGMSRTYLRLFAAIVFTLISLTLLTWGLWPYQRIVHRQIIQPTEMQVPTPDSFAPSDRLV